MSDTTATTQFQSSGGAGAPSWGEPIRTHNGRAALLEEKGQPVSRDLEAEWPAQDAGPGQKAPDIARVKRCLIECGMLEDLADMLDDILDADAGDVSADVARRRDDIACVVAWLSGEARAA